MLLPVVKDYSEYWGMQVHLVRILQSADMRVDIRDRLPLFRLWLVVDRRMTGSRKNNILQLIQSLIHMRMKGLEPPHEGGKYTK